VNYVYIGVERWARSATGFSMLPGTIPSYISDAERLRKGAWLYVNQSWRSGGAIYASQNVYVLCMPALPMYEPSEILLSKWEIYQITTCLRNKENAQERRLGGCKPCNR
jgi:hypothetical protein